MSTRGDKWTSRWEAMNIKKQRSSCGRKKQRLRLAVHTTPPLCETKQTRRWTPTFIGSSRMEFPESGTFTLPFQRQVQSTTADGRQNLGRGVHTAHSQRGRLVSAVKRTHNQTMPHVRRSSYWSFPTRFPVHKTCCILFGTSIFLNFSGMAASR